MKRSLKKQIKQDELVGWYEQVQEWTRVRAEQLKIGGIGLVVLLVGASALFSFRSHRAREAERALAEALDIFHAPLAQAQPAAAGPAAAPAGFSTAAEKYRKALAAFDGVQQRYGSLTAGRWAALYAALCRVELGLDGDAESALKALAARQEKGALEPSLARLALADLARRKAQADRAIDQYRSLLDSPQSQIPQDYILLNLAQTLEEAKRPAEAVASYRRLVDEFPTSVYQAEARQRAEQLKLLVQGG